METLRPARLPERALDSHKGDYGRVLIVAGSRAYPGAALLSVLGAGRAGAGYVRLAAPAEILPLVMPGAPFCIPRGLPSSATGGLDERAEPELRQLAADSDVVVLGPGLGTDEGTRRLTELLIPRLTGLLVLDADALNLLATGDPRTLRERRAPTVLTPHPGEWKRLAERLDLPPFEAGSRDERREDQAADLAHALGVVVVLKGHRSVICDGERSRIEPRGHPAMAKAGMGDVLSGALGALLARVPDAAEATALAVRAHALAGELAAQELGPEGVLPQDLADRLGRALALSEQEPDWEQPEDAAIG
ncbi:MAG: hypothetical protein DHS20C15_18580 [Planctomycetota bacterium]|nr:MAG: hypothetical protein DHS20C15_18580 [Planctomycetota bacterium]